MNSTDLCLHTDSLTHAACFVRSPGTSAAAAGGGGGGGGGQNATGENAKQGVVQGEREKKPGGDEDAVRKREERRAEDQADALAAMQRLGLGGK